MAAYAQRGGVEMEFDEFDIHCIGFFCFQVLILILAIIAMIQNKI